MTQRAPYRVQITQIGPHCGICGHQLDFEPCQPCAGTGAISSRIPGRQRCPIHIDDCEDCEGQGGHWICPNVLNH